MKTSAMMARGWIPSPRKSAEMIAPSHSMPTHSLPPIGVQLSVGRPVNRAHRAVICAAQPLLTDYSLF